MSGFVFLDDKLRIKPGIATAYSAGKPAGKEPDIPQTGALGVTTDLEADISDTLRLDIDGRINISTYQNFNKLRILNTQLPSIEIHSSQSNLSQIQFKLDRAKLNWYGEALSFNMGYQKIVFGTNEFAFAPANTFAGTDFSSPNQIPEHRSVFAARLNARFSECLSLSFVAAPSAETRDIIPLAERIKINNPGYEANVDALLAFRAEWPKFKLLLEVGHEHDHFFKVSEGELVYPRRETAAAEVSGVWGNLTYWMQGNFSYYPDHQNAKITFPLGEKELKQPEYFHQQAAGVKYYFPHYYAFVASQIFNGSITGNGENEKKVASLSFGKTFLNNDLKIKADLNCYFDSGNADFEGYLNSTYLVTSGLELSLGGRIAQEKVFTLAQPIHGYLGIEYNFKKR